MDIVSDGELSKNSVTNYVKDRLSGLDAVNPDPYPSRPPLFPEYAESLRSRVVNLGTRPLNTQPFGWKNFGEVERDITNLKSTLQGTRHAEAFMPSVAVGQVLFMIPSTYYSSEKDYLYALADVLRREYRAIVDAGFVLQVDSPDVPMMCDRQLWNVPFEDYRKHPALRVEALNHALQDIPEERIRSTSVGATMKLRMPMTCRCATWSIWSSRSRHRRTRSKRLIRGARTNGKSGRT